MDKAPLWKSQNLGIRLKHLPGQQSLRSTASKWWDKWLHSDYIAPPSCQPTTALRVPPAPRPLVFPVGNKSPGWTFRLFRFAGFFPGGLLGSHLMGITGETETCRASLLGIRWRQRRVAELIATSAQILAYHIPACSGSKQIPANSCTHG